MKKITLITLVVLLFSGGAMAQTGQFEAIDLNRGAWPYVRFLENGSAMARIQGSNGQFLVTSLNGGTNYFTVNSSSGLVGVAQNLFVGPLQSSSGTLGRLSISGSSAELSIANRSVSGFVDTPTQGERWVIYNEGSATDGKLRFWSGGDKVVFTKEGSVGISTTAPAWALDVGGSGSGKGIIMATGDEAFVGWYDRTLKASSVTNRWGWYASNGKAGLWDGLNSVDRMTITNSGNVGIGTTAPRGKFDVDGAGDIYLNDEPINGAGQSIFLPGHIYISPHTSSANVAYLQARRSDNSGTTSLRIRTFNNGSLTEAMHIEGNGNIGIGNSSPGTYKLAVEGKIGAREVNVTTTAWSDYVFNSDYKLRPLNEVQQFIEENHHLPEVPSEKEVLANGQNLGEMNAVLLRKIEELTLYVLDQQKEIDALRQRTDSPDLSVKKIEELTLHVIEQSKINEQLRIDIENSARKMVEMSQQMIELKNAIKN